MIEIRVERPDERWSLDRAIEKLREQCIDTRLTSDINRHQYFEKLSLRKKEKHWKAVMKQKQENEKRERKREKGF